MASPYEKGPRKINPVSILIVGGLAVAGYAAFVFLPPYWTSWDVKEKLRNACSSIYAMRLYDPALRTSEMQKLQDKVLNEMKGLGIQDPDATVEIDDSDPQWAVVRADYHVTVTFFKPKIMHFTPEAKMDMTPSSNDKKK